MKGPYRQKQRQKQNKKEWANSVDLCQRHKPPHPHQVKVSPLGRCIEERGSTHAKRVPSAQNGLRLDELHTVTVCVLDVDEYGARVDEIEVVSYMTSP